MSAISDEEAGGKAPEEEKLNIPSFVRITNTSGFAIPASILNRIWAALTYQIANRNETVVGTVDNNFIAYFLNHVLGIPPVSPVTVKTMTSYTDTVYAANIGQNFATCIIPEVFWQHTGYQAKRLGQTLGEKESFIDLKIWVEGYDNESLSASHRLRSPNPSATPYINIGTTFGQTLWSTDFLYQRMKAHNETIARILTKDPEALQVGHGLIDTLRCKSSIDGEAPIISPILDDLYQFAKDNHRFLIQTCLNNDTKECITTMQGSDPNFPNFNNVSKLYYGLEVIPISSQGLSRLELVMASTKRLKAKASKNKRRKAKRKIDGAEQAGEATSVATVQTEIAEINYADLNDEENLGEYTEENNLESTVDETLDVAHLLGEATTEKAEDDLSERINAEAGILTNQRQAELHVPMGGHGQESSYFTAQSKSQSVQLTQDQTIPQVITLAKDTPVSVTVLARDEEISVTTLPGDAPNSVTTIAATGTSPTKNAASPQTDIPASDRAASQTAAPTRGTASFQTTMPTKDAVILQATAPVEVQVISQVVTATSTSPSHTGDQSASIHNSQFISEDRARAIAQLRAQPLPPSLEEARARRASIKEERRQNIDFIRMRTSSRASALALSMASTAQSEILQLPQTSGPLANTNLSLNPPRQLEKVSEFTSNGAANDGHTADSHLKLPGPIGQPFESLSNVIHKDAFIADLTLALPRSMKHSSDNTNQITTSPHLAQLPSPVAQENVKPKRGKWIAPLPEDQHWRGPSQSLGTSTATSASSLSEKRQKKLRRNVKPSVQSRVSVGTQTETGFTSCSVGTQMEIGVATSIAEDLVPGAGPVPSREDELAGHGSTKPPPSVTSRASLQRELELTSTVEDPALEQGCGGESARGRLTMAAPSTPHSHLVAELTGAGVPASALTSLSRPGLEADEATDRRQTPVGIQLEVESVTIGGVTFDAPRRYGSRHRIAASMPKLELDW